MQIVKDSRPLGLVSRAPGGVIDLADRAVAAVAARDGSAPLYLRVDILPGRGGAPCFGVREGVDPELFFRALPGSERRFRELVTVRLGRG